MWHKIYKLFSLKKCLYVCALTNCLWLKYARVQHVDCDRALRVMFQINDLLPDHSPPLQRKATSKSSPEERRPSEPTLGVIEAVVTGTPAVKHAVEDPIKTAKDKFNDEISYTLMSNCNLKPNRVFTITPVKTETSKKTENDRISTTDPTKCSWRPARTAVRRTTSGLPTVTISGQHNTNNFNKLFLRNDTSPVLLKPKNNNIQSKSHHNTNDSSTKRELTKTLSSGSFRQQPNGSTATSANGGEIPSTNSNGKQSFLGRRNTESKLPATHLSHQMSKPHQGSPIVYHPPLGRSSSAQESFNELMKSNSHTMPPGCTQFFIRSPAGTTDPGTSLVRSTTEASLLGDSLEDVSSSRGNSLGKNSGMRVLGYIWTFWNKGQTPNLATTVGSPSNDIIRIPPGRILWGEVISINT